jgi:putative ABC transport system ATP-binding protein
MPPITQLIDVYKSYQMGEIEVPALRGITIDIAPGEFTVFAGPSGSGKTTLLNLVGLLDVPAKGRVLMEGKDVSKLSSHEQDLLRAKHVGFIFQSFNLVPVLTAFENVELALRISESRVSKTERQARVHKILLEVGLEEFMNRRPSQLSGGQQQRVAVARALVKKTSLVIADEPTANLDSVSANSVLDVMCAMNELHDVTFLFSSHDEKVINRAKRIVWLRDGQVERVEERTPQVVA